MTLIEAKIILNKRKECDARMKKYRDRCGRCTPCPLYTSLDDYMTARLVVSTHTVYKDTDAIYVSEEMNGEHTKAVLNSLYGEGKN